MGVRIISCCECEKEEHQLTNLVTEEPIIIKKAKDGNLSQQSKEDFKANLDFVNIKTKHYFDQLGGLNKNKFKKDIEEVILRSPRNNTDNIVYNNDLASSTSILNLFLFSPPT